MILKRIFNVLIVVFLILNYLNNNEFNHHFFKFQFKILLKYNVVVIIL